MRYEAEIVSDEILPAIRKVVSERLKYDFGFTQEEIAGKLEITQPAVSQYMKGKRSDSEVVNKLKEDPQADILLDEAASKAAKEKDFSDEIGQLIFTARDKGLFQNKFKDARRIL